MTVRTYDAVLFDLLTALLDSWTLWAEVAGSPAVGRRWREEYLRRTYSAGDYRPYETLVAEAAAAQRLDSSLPGELTARWGEMTPWPEAPVVLRQLSGAGVRLGAVTNCSETLGHQAAGLLDDALDLVVTSEAAGAYKPRPEPYKLALSRLDLPADRVLFVAGSKFDLPGAAAVGMPVWWHNRIHMDRRELPAPLAEHDTLSPLIHDVLSPNPNSEEAIR